MKIFGIACMAVWAFNASAVAEEINAEADAVANVQVVEAGASIKLDAPEVVEVVEPPTVEEPQQNVVISVIDERREGEDVGRELWCAASAYKQCGGHNWRGCTGCPSGYFCKYKNYWWSDCQKGTTGSCSSKALGQCGGKNFNGCKGCPTGYYCKYANTYWSDCQRGASAQSFDPSPSPPSSSPPPPSSSGLPNRSYSVSVPGMFDGTVSGQSTYFGITTGGNCGYDKLPAWRPNWMQQSATVGSNNPDKFWPVAVAPSVWNGSKACGMCLVAKLSTDQRQYYGFFSGVRFGVVYDQCPGCGRYGDIDWRGNGNGRFNHQWIAIECPVDRDSTNFVYYAEEVQGYYLKIQVRNTRVPVQSGKIRFEGHGWQSMNFAPSNDNFFVVECSGYCAKTFDIELTSQFGSKVTDYGISWGGDKMAYGGTQFSSKMA